jgi:hypothetical protein
VTVSVSGNEQSNVFVKVASTVTIVELGGVAFADAATSKLEAIPIAISAARRIDRRFIILPLPQLRRTLLLLPQGVKKNTRSILSCMSSDGRPYARFRRALDVRSVLQAEAAARELGRLGLLDALDYLALLAAEAPYRYDRAARKWLARLLSESPALTLDEVGVARGCLRGVGALYEEPSRRCCECW